MFNRAALTFFALIICSPILAGTSICDKDVCTLVGDLPVYSPNQVDGAVQVTFAQGQLTVEDTLVANFALPGARLVIGDWNGDGVEEPGAYAGGFWILQTGWALHAPQILVDMTGLGHSSKAIPLVGSWKGAAIDGIGLYDSGVFTLYADYNDLSNSVVIDFGDVANDTRTAWESMPFVGQFEKEGDQVALSKGENVAYAPRPNNATYDFLGGDTALVSATLPFRGYGALGRARPYALDMSRLGTGESGHILAFRYLPTTTSADRQECFVSEEYYCLTTGHPIDEGAVIVPIGHTW